MTIARIFDKSHESTIKFIFELLRGMYQKLSHERIFEKTFFFGRFTLIWHLNFYLLKWRMHHSFKHMFYTQFFILNFFNKHVWIIQIFSSFFFCYHFSQMSISCTRTVLVHRTFFVSSYEFYMFECMYVKI